MKVKTKEATTSSEDRLQTARSNIRSIGTIFSIYSSAIRAIGSASSILKTTDAAAIKLFAVSSAYAPISISPTLTQSFKLAAAELYPSQYRELTKSGNVKFRQVLMLLEPSEIKAVLGITYFFKLLSKACEPVEFTRFTPILSTHLRMGALIGAQTGTQFGRGGGLAAAGLRCLAIAVMIKANPKAFKGYRRLIEESGVLSHSAYELQHFGCTHLDIASVLAGDLGFGPIAREAYLVLQFGLAKASTPEGIHWNHTLKEAAKLWSARQALQPKDSTKKTTSISPNSQDGYLWLWGQSNSTEVLPGIETEEISSLIPDQKSPSQPIYAVKHEQEPSTQLSVLIVEDEMTSARLLEKHLQTLGQVTICESAEAAMTILAAPQQSMPFDLIFLDVGLPGMSGLQLLNSIRDQEQKMSTPEEARCTILMMTGDENPQTVMKAFSHGADGYLTKPFKRDEIKDELAKYQIWLGKAKDKPEAS